MPKETLIAEVKYSTDEASMRDVLSRSQRAVKQYNDSLMEASRRQTQQFQGSQWMRDMMHAAPGGLPMPGFMVNQQAMAQARAAATAGINAYGGAGSSYGPARQPNPEIIRRANNAVKVGNSDFIDRSYMTAAAYRNQIKAMEASSAAAKKNRDGILQLSYALQDFQAAGIKGMLNNIPNIMQGFGMSSKAAGAGLLAGVAGMFWSDVVIPAIKTDLGMWTDESRAAFNEERANADKVLARQQMKAAGEYVKAIQDRISRMNEADAALMASFSRESRLLDAKHDTEKVWLESLEGSARIEAEGRQTQKEIKENAERALQFHQARLKTEMAERDAYLSEASKINAQMAVLEKRPKVPFQSTNSRGQLVKEMRYDNATAGEMEALTKKHGAADDAYQAMLSRIKDREKTIKDIQFEANEMARQAAATSAARAKSAKNREAAERSRKEQENLLRLTEEEQKLQKRRSESMDRIHQSMRDFNSRLQAGLDDSRTREIEDLRKRGHGARADRLQRQFDKDKRVRDLMDGKNGPAMDRASAEAQAAAEESRARGKVGVRTPRGDSPSALDGDPFARRNFRPQTPALDEARKPSARSRAKKAAADPAPQAAKDPVADAVKAGTEKTVAAINDLKGALKTPAEKVAPIQ